MQVKRSCSSYRRWSYFSNKSVFDRYHSQGSLRGSHWLVRRVLCGEADARTSLAAYPTARCISCTIFHPPSITNQRCSVCKWRAVAYCHTNECPIAIPKHARTHTIEMIRERLFKLRLLSEVLRGSSSGTLYSLERVPSRPLQGPGNGVSALHS